MRTLGLVWVTVATAACGNDIHGAHAPCIDEACAGALITAGGVGNIVASSSTLYWTDDGHAGLPGVFARPLVGGAITRVGAGATYFTGLELSGDALVWSNNFGLRLIELTSSGEKRLSDHPVQYGFGLDDAHAYIGLVDDKIAKVDLADFTETTIATPHTPLDLLVRDGTIYFTTCGAVYAVPSAGGAVTRVAESYCPIWLAANSTSVMWSDDDADGSAHIFRVDPTTGAVDEVLELARADVYGLAADDSHVYVQAGQTVYRSPLDGGVELRTVAEGVAQFAVVGTRLYFSTLGGDLRVRPL